MCLSGLKIGCVLWYVCVACRYACVWTEQYVCSVWMVVHVCVCALNSVWMFVCV